MSVDWSAVRAAQRTQYTDTQFHFNPTERLPRAKFVDWKALRDAWAERVGKLEKQRRRGR